MNLQNDTKCNEGNNYNFGTDARWIVTCVHTFCINRSALLIHDVLCEIVQVERIGEIVWSFCILAADRSHSTLMLANHASNRALDALGDNVEDATKVCRSDSETGTQIQHMRARSYNPCW